MLKEGTAPGTKTCMACKKEFPATREYFWVRSRRGTTGFSPRCKPCQTAFRAEYEQRVADGTQSKTEKLDAGPFKEWILKRREFYFKQSFYDIGAGQAEFCRRSGLSERRCNEITKRSKFVTLDLVDRTLVNEGSTMLWELYPELYE